ncbi:MAG: 2OG-Fe(II) oxygenase [Flammeovirgaceae bacterium]
MKKLLVIDDYLSEEQIMTLLEGIQFEKKATVYNKESPEEAQLKLAVRNTYRCSLPPHKEALLSKRFMELCEEANTTFQLKSAVSTHQCIEFLCYLEGHFFKAHRDSHPEIDTEGKRQVTAILYLNDSSKYDECGFEGGELYVYGVHEQFPHSGFPIYAKKGRLVLFQSHLLHEVKPLQSGERYCVVTWLS